METKLSFGNRPDPLIVYSEVEPFEGWKPVTEVAAFVGDHGSIARSNPLRDGNTTTGVDAQRPRSVYSEVEPFEGWKRTRIGAIVGEAEGL